MKNSARNTGRHPRRTTESGAPALTTGLRAQSSLYPRGHPRPCYTTQRPALFHADNSTRPRSPDLPCTPAGNAPIRDKWGAEAARGGIMGHELCGSCRRRVATRPHLLCPRLHSPKTRRSSQLTNGSTSRGGAEPTTPDHEDTKTTLAPANGHRPGRAKGRNDTRAD